MKPSRTAASFDSASGMLRALSRYLRGQDVPMLGQFPRRLEPALSGVLGAVNHLPPRAAERLYAAGGVMEALRPEQAGEVDAEQLASWVVGHYPRRRYPVVFLGSSNGALVHLAAAMSAPWLPQTLLVPIRRRGGDRDDPRSEIDAGIEPGTALLRANPDIALHHMHDPNQDRLMIAGMSYFRIKWQRLPAAYRRFLREHLAPGGVVVSVECEQSWPVTRVGDRHVFQFGAFGGATIEEYHTGGARVADLLRRYGATRRAWSPPEADEQAPEAEWGFDPALSGDLGEEAERQGFTTRRLRFPSPETLSDPVADIHRDWYARCGGGTGRLLADTFMLMDPWWTLRTGSVPYWLVFNTRHAHDRLEHYLDRVDPYDEIRLLLFSHGADSIGLATAGEWQQVVGRARKLGTLVGVDEQAYPRDFATLARAHRELARVRHLHDLTEPLDFSRAEAHLRASPQVRHEAVIEPAER